MVTDLRQLRSALAELPDVPPSRPLQLVPPVPEVAPARVGGFVGILRRFTAPAMSAAAVLILVGVIGTVVNGLPIGASAGAAPLNEAAASAGIAGGQPAASDTHSDYVAQVPATRNAGGQGSGTTPVPAAPLNPFPWFLGLGVVLLAAGFVARGYVRRQEGDLAP